MPAYTLALGIFFASTHLPDDVYNMWWIGSWAAGFTIIVFRCRPAIIGAARYWGAVAVFYAISAAGVFTANSYLHHEVVLVPRLLLAVAISTIAIAASIAFVHAAGPRRFSAGTESGPDSSAGPIMDSGS